MRLCALDNPLTTYRLMSSLHHTLFPWRVFLQGGHLIVQSGSWLQVLRVLTYVILLLHQMIVKNGAIAWRASCDVACRRMI